MLDFYGSDLKEEEENLYAKVWLSCCMKMMVEGMSTKTWVFSELFVRFNFRVLIAIEGCRDFGNGNGIVSSCVF